VLVEVDTVDGTLAEVEAGGRALAERPAAARWGGGQRRAIEEVEADGGALEEVEASGRRLVGRGGAELARRIGTMPRRK
jgi:hypothetical protein